MLSTLDIDRYSRQLLLPELTGRAQERLLETRVLLWGDGPGALTAAAYLRAAGVDTPQRATGSLDAPKSDLVDGLGAIIANGVIPSWLSEACSARQIPYWLILNTPEPRLLGPLGVPGQVCADCIRLHINAPQGETPRPAIEALCGVLVSLAVLRWLLGLDAGTCLITVEPNTGTWHVARPGPALPCPDHGAGA